MEFREITPGDALFEEMLPLLPPQVLEIGQKVWWNDVPGTLCEGVVRGIELGYKHHFKPSYACRRYVAQRTRTVRHERGGAVSWRDHEPNHYDWKSGCGYPESPFDIYPLFVNLEDAKKAAARDMQRWADDAKRSYEERLKWVAAIKELV